MTDEQVSRGQVISFRWRAHQLDRDAGSAAGVDEVELLDFGVQDTGPVAARWALANRGLADYAEADTLLAWTLRVSPHLYRRRDAAAIATATAPLSEADAAKRLYDASKTLQAAGIAVLDALAEVSRQQRALVAEPIVKGALSTALTGVLDPPYLRECRPCGCTHCWESTFRLAPLQGGLELQPGTSPPVLQRIPEFRPPFFAASGVDAESRFNVVRNYLRFFGPARPADAAAYLDAPVKEVSAHWPEDAVPVQVTDGPAVKGVRSVLAGDLPALGSTSPAPGAVRLLGPYDGYLQLKDRAMLVPDPVRQKEIWQVLGRPGTIAVDGEIVGTWRPRSAGKKLTVVCDPWVPSSRSVRAAVAEQAELLAGARGQSLADVTQG